VGPGPPVNRSASPSPATTGNREVTVVLDLLGHCPACAMRTPGLLCVTVGIALCMFAAHIDSYSWTPEADLYPPQQYQP
jgi:hypothetical protein